jgi:hypothetical protein
MAKTAKQTMEIPNAIYESMLKVFIKTALEKKYQVYNNPDKVHQKPRTRNTPLKFNIN